jgi:hypothetical protein
MNGVTSTNLMFSNVKFWVIVIWFNVNLEQHSMFFYICFLTTIYSMSVKSDHAFILRYSSEVLRLQREITSNLKPVFGLANPVYLCLGLLLMLKWKKVCKYTNT